MLVDWFSKGLASSNLRVAVTINGPATIWEAFSTAARLEPTHGQPSARNAKEWAKDHRHMVKSKGSGEPSLVAM